LASVRGGEPTTTPSRLPDDRCNRVSPGADRVERLAVRQCASPAMMGAHIHVAFTLSSLTSFEAITMNTPDASHP
jgi:hypothetical protein